MSRPESISSSRVLSNSYRADLIKVLDDPGHALSLPPSSVLSLTDPVPFLCSLTSAGFLPHWPAKLILKFSQWTKLSPAFYLYYCLCWKHSSQALVLSPVALASVPVISPQTSVPVISLQTSALSWGFLSTLRDSSSPFSFLSLITVCNICERFVLMFCCCYFSAYLSHYIIVKSTREEVIRLVYFCDLHAWHSAHQ